MPRKLPYSGKQKKQQLKDKKCRKQAGPSYLRDSDGDSDGGGSSQAAQEARCDTHSKPGASSQSLPQVQKLNLQPGTLPTSQTSRLDANSFRLHFFKEDEQTIKKRKNESRKPVKPVAMEYREWKIEDAYPVDAKLDFPKRPPWNYSASREELERKEQKYFNEYVRGILDQPRAQDLSFFELNIETWRQLWRVLEMSDVFLLIADIRYPALHIPPQLVDYIMKDLHKQLIILLNKIDFVPPSLALAWKRYLEIKFPGIHIVFFSSYPADGSQAAVLQKKPSRRKYLPVGPEELYRTVKNIVKDDVALSLWEDRIKANSLNDGQSADAEQGQTCEQEYEVSTDQCPAKTYKDGVVTIGCLGYPNAGKSSVLNALVGKKVVSVSKTPGHTKHFQTIYLCPSVKLCDCPGLVFPSMVPKSLQVIAGIFPVAQVKEPYSVISYLAKRLDLPKLLQLRPLAVSPNKKTADEWGEYLWSAYDICEAWAIKCGFTTSKAGRPDMFRAANKILRLAVEGQLCLCFFPPGYIQSKESADLDADVKQLAQLLSSPMKPLLSDNIENGEDEDEEDEDGNLEEGIEDEENYGGGVSSFSKKNAFEKLEVMDDDTEDCDDDGEG